MNREGQIPILMLFVVTLILVIVALMTFAVFNRNFDENPLNVSRTIAKVQFGEGYIVESAKSIAASIIQSKNDKDLRTSFIKSAKSFDRKINDPANNFSAKIGDGEFRFDKLDNIYKLVISGLFVQATYGTSQITRKLDLCMLFDSDGKYIEQRFNETSEKKYAEHCKKAVG